MDEEKGACDRKDNESCLSEGLGCLFVAVAIVLLLWGLHSFIR